MMMNGMGMDNMMNMGNSMGGSMNASGSMGTMGNMGGYMGNMGGYMSGQAQMNMGNMPGMANPNAMNGVANNGSLFGGFDLNSILGGILNLAIDIFAILLIVGLVVGAVVLIKRYLSEGEVFTPGRKAACPHCGQPLNGDWHCCPKCGQPITAQAQPQPAKVNPQTV